MHKGNQRPSLWSFFDARELQKLGPIVSEDEFFGDESSARLVSRFPWFTRVPSEKGKYRCVALTPDKWGDSLKDHGIKFLVRQRVEVTGVAQVPIKQLYGGVWNTAEWSKNFGGGDFAKQEFLCSTYLFSMNR